MIEDTRGYNRGGSVCSIPSGPVQSGATWRGMVWCGTIVLFSSCDSDSPAVKIQTVLLPATGGLFSIVTATQLYIDQKRLWIQYA